MKTASSTSVRQRSAPPTQKRASVAPRPASKFARLRRLAEQEPGEVGAALSDLSDSFTRMASQLAALKDNLDLADLPKEASVRQKLAHKNRYGSTLKRLATESPEELAGALSEFYSQLDDVAGEVENFADNIGVELTPAEDEGADEEALMIDGPGEEVDEEVPVEETEYEFDDVEEPVAEEEVKMATRQRLPRRAAPRGLDMRRAAKPGSGIEMKVVRDSGDSKLSLVKENGVTLGFIEKFEDDADTTNPYKAFNAITGQGPVRVGDTMKAFYEPNGLKNAIAYLKSLDASGRPTGPSTRGRL